MHYIRIPFPAFGHKPLQNYLHAVQGLAILGLANYQVGLYSPSTESVFLI